MAKTLKKALMRGKSGMEQMRLKEGTKLLKVEPTEDNWLWLTFDKGDLLSNKYQYVLFQWVAEDEDFDLEKWVPLAKVGTFQIYQTKEFHDRSSQTEEG